MNEISDILWRNLSDEALEKQIGFYVKKIRQQQNKTQTDIAKAANISRSTLSLLERGESGNLKTLIQVLRVLDKLQILSIFDYQEPLSPLALAKAQNPSIKRVRPSKRKQTTAIKKKSTW